MPESKASGVRINKAVAMSGIASRRNAEKLILAGKVQVNGKTVTDLATRVDPRSDKISVNGKALEPEHSRYYIYYKPRGEISTMEDERGRRCTGDLCRSLPGSPVLVGRLDRASEGLALLTNDGSIANHILHPRYEVSKEYQATVQPQLSEDAAKRAVEGVRLEDGIARFTSIVLEDQERDRSRVLVTVEEGRNRLIRRVFHALGFDTLRLRRIRIATLSLGNLKPGEYRELTDKELANLKRALKFSA